MHIYSNINLTEDEISKAVAQLTMPGIDVNSVADEPRKKSAHLNSNIFTLFTHQLRSSFPNEAIRDLCGDLWNLCNNQIVPVVMLESEILKTITFLGRGKKVDGKIKLIAGAIGLPDNYYNVAIEQSAVQRGGVVYVASQARDFWNGQVDPFIVQKRAHAYEATYILELQKMDPEYVCSEYQKYCLETTPHGINDILELLYETQPTPPEGSYRGEKPHFSR